jgi:hypothetical protein
MTRKTDRLPSSVNELREVMASFSTQEGFRSGLAFKPRPSDVFVATYPKCGTTLVQQIVHGLRTCGDMDFADISEVVPWLELAADLDQDPNAEQRGNPRAYKTHLPWGMLPKGGRTIYVLRDPEAVLVSFYHFFSGWFFEPGAFDLETFALDYLLSRDGGADYWVHLASWWPHRDDPEVLYLFYEDLVADRSGEVRRIASFLGFEEDEGRIEVATRQSSIDFMRRTPTLWEDTLLCEKRNEAMGLPDSARSTKLRKGSGDRPDGELSQAVVDAWRARWAEVVAPVTGCADYPAIRRAVSGASGSD